VSLLRAILLLLVTVSAGAEVRIDAYAEPAGDVYLGQRVRLIVDVRTDTWFTSAPRYPDLKVEGAIALMPEGFGINFTEREGNKTWAGQRQRYVLFPQRVGQLVIPGFELPLAVSIDARAGDIQVVTTPPVTISVIAPPGSGDVPAFVTTPRLTVTDSWDRDFEDLKVGDAITRTITQEADDVFALVLQTIDFADIDGFGVYPAVPELDDRANRGSYSATRTDKVTYVLQVEGEYVLPEIEFHWFDLRSGRMRTETLETIDVNVLPNPNALLGDPEPAAEERSSDPANALRRALDWFALNIHWLTLLAGALFAIRWLWRRFVPGWLESLRARRERHRHSEARFFDELLVAVHSGNADRIVASFWRWADRLPGRRPPLSISAIAQDQPESGFADMWRDFEAARYGGATDGKFAVWKVSSTDLRQLRRSWLRDCAPGRRVGMSPPSPERLNP